VALTAHDMSDMGRLAQLAMNPKSGASREEIYLAVASLYRIQGAGLNQRERELMREILRKLTLDVEMAIRIALAQRLAVDTTAPHDLIMLLVDDRVEVARPLILNSPLLTETDMLRLIAQADAAHQEALASRPHIGMPVTDALVQSDHESILTALVRNATAKISEAAYKTLVEKSRTIAGLQEPLVQRPDMPPALAEAMCEWVSDALKNFIKANPRMAPKAVDAAVDAAVWVVQNSAAGAQLPPGDSAQKLVDKLATSGQLRTGFLMRVLGQGQVDMFDLAFARLLEVDVAGFRKVFYRDGARAVAVCCRAVGIDRAVFATVFNLSRQSRRMPAVLSKADLTTVDSIFTGITRQAALDELRGAMASA
jgi:uncharacterized protein (DUF2336 family)